MNDQLKKAINQLKQVKLEPEEKADLRNIILAEIGQPVLTTRTIFSFWRVASLALILALASGGVLVLAAEGALPGEILYPIKTRITEPVTRLIHRSPPDNRADFETQLVDKRLHEAEELDKEKKFDDASPEREKFKETVKKQVVEQTTRAEEAIARIPKKEAVKEVEEVTPKKEEKEIKTENNQAKKVQTEVIEEKKEKTKTEKLDQVLKDHEEIVKKLEFKNNNPSQEKSKSKK